LGEFVRGNAHRLHRMLADLHRQSMEGLKVVNNEGEAVEFGRSEYEVTDDAALLSALRAVEVLREDAAGPAGTHGFTWLQPMGEMIRPFGHVEASAGRLLLEAQSRTRLQTLRGLIESNAGGLVRHVRDFYESVADILAAKRSGPAPASPAAEIEREALLAFKSAHYKSWPDDPLPALGGKTARQAVRTKKGRQAVRDLLRMLENDEQREGKRGGVAYDFNVIRRELGLDEE
jgi:hypothetical protein